MIAEETERGWVVVLDAALIGSADARAIDRYTERLQRQEEIYYKSPVLRRNDKSEDISARWRCSTPSSPPAARGLAAALQGAGRDEFRAAVGDHARPQRPLAAAGEGQRTRPTPIRCSRG
jgi:hypothetical protein